MDKLNIMSVGEVLWDVFPDGRRLGGAPLNFTYHASRLGAETHIASRVGDDEAGREALEEMRRHGLSIDGVGVHSRLPTGRVDVEIKPGGHAFHIREDAAYDEIIASENSLHFASMADAVCFGSLAQRGEISRESIRRIAHRAKSAKKVFDINIRQRFYTEEIIRESLEIADILKLNEDEIGIISETLSIHADATDSPQKIMERFHLEMICVTLGDKGCRIYAGGDVVFVPGYPVEVVDTVGSGDAFTAAMIVARLEGMSLRETGRFANALGAMTASTRGAMFAYERGDIQKFTRAARDAV